jgi:hypothetical protein
MRKLDEVSKNARRLLRSLGVNSPADAADGAGSRELLAALVLLGERNEDPVIEAVGSGSPKKAARAEMLPICSLVLE